MKVSARMRDLMFWLSRLSGYPLMAPDVIQIPMTQACNLRCAMCSIHEGDGAVLNRETISGILDQAAAMGIREVVLTGGEPLLRKDLLEICCDCRFRGLRSILTTNGTLVDEALALKILDSGLSHIHFSVDGLEKANDRVRGPGNFNKTVQGIKILDRLRKIRSRDLSIGIACTVMDHNLEDLPGLVECADAWGVDVINFQPLLKDNANTPDRGDAAFWVTEARWPVLDEMIAKVRELKLCHIQIYEEPKLRLFSRYYRRILSQADWKCFGGYKTLFVCMGDRGVPLVYTCHGICGNLAESSLRDCWVSAEAQRLRRSSKLCKDLCLQSCYSRESSDSFRSVCRGLLR